MGRLNYFSFSYLSHIHPFLKEQTVEGNVCMSRHTQKKKVHSVFFTATLLNKVAVKFIEQTELICYSIEQIYNQVTHPSRQKQKKTKNTIDVAFTYHRPHHRRYRYRCR